VASKITRKQPKRRKYADDEYKPKNVEEPVTQSGEFTHFIVRLKETGRPHSNEFYNVLINKRSNRSLKRFTESIYRTLKEDDCGVDLTGHEILEISRVIKIAGETRKLMKVTDTLLKRTQFNDYTELIIEYQ